MLRYEYGAVSDQGDVRSENQDSVLCLTGEVGPGRAALFAVADGMGGLSYGSRVSRHVTGQLRSWWEEDLCQLAGRRDMGGEALSDLFDQAVWEINREILRFSREQGSRCGSTLSLLLCCGGQYSLRNIGDSRIYQCRGGKLRQLTQDQSYVAQMVREGRMSREEAERSPGKNVLTMCLGAFEKPEVFCLEGRLHPGDRFLLCSDGLYRALEAGVMEEIMAGQALSAQERAGELRSRIAPGGASDNVSAVVVHAVREKGAWPWSTQI